MSSSSEEVIDNASFNSNKEEFSAIKSEILAIYSRLKIDIR